MINKYWLDRNLFTSWNFHKNELLKHFSEYNAESIQKIDKAMSLIRSLHAEPRFDGLGIANVHLLRVPRILIEEMEEKQLDIILVGILHDILEDTSYSEDTLRNNFGEFVLEGVKVLTRPRDKDWEQYANEVVSYGNTSIIKVKIADKLDNARSHAFSKNEELRAKDFYKTTKIIPPIVKKFYPQIWPEFESVIERWNKPL